MESMKTQFTCANPEKTTAFKEKVAQIRKEQDDQLQFESHKSNPVPRNMLVCTDLFLDCEKYIHQSYCLFEI